LIRIADVPMPLGTPIGRFGSGVPSLGAVPPKVGAPAVGTLGTVAVGPLGTVGVRTSGRLGTLGSPTPAPPLGIRNDALGTRGFGALRPGTRVGRRIADVPSPSGIAGVRLRRSSASM
jgi:hypothetical protein